MRGEGKAKGRVRKEAARCIADLIRGDNGNGADFSPVEMRFAERKHNLLGCLPSKTTMAFLIAAENIPPCECFIREILKSVVQTLWSWRAAMGILCVIVANHHKCLSMNNLQLASAVPDQG